MSRKLEGLLQSNEEEEGYECKVVRVNKKRPGQHEGEEEDEYRRGKINVRMGDFIELSFVSTRTRQSSIIGPEPVIKNLWFPMLSIRTIPPHLFGPDIGLDHNGLVRNDFSETRMDLLRTLLTAGQMMLHVPNSNFPEITHSRDALQQGIRMALYASNLRALDILLKLDLFFYRGSLPYYTIPSDHFRIAAQQYINTANFHKGLVSYIDDPYIKRVHDAALLPFVFLLHSSAESVPHDDPVVRQFAKVEDGAFGAWLLDLMKFLPRHVEKLKKDNDGYDTVFVARSPNDTAVDMASVYKERVMSWGVYFRMPVESLVDDLSRYDDDDYDLFD